MNILLISPSSKSVFRSVGVSFPPLGLLYIAAAVRNKGYKVTVIDRNVHRRRINFSTFDVVGIHSDTTRFHQALQLAHQAKASGAQVVMGGPHPCFVAREILETGLVDAVVRGEGEVSFPDLLDAWQMGKDASTIPGLIYTASDGLRDTGDPDRIQDLDSLPLPARDLIDLKLYSNTRLGFRSITPVHTSRGCPYGCRFCSSTHFDGPLWRSRSSANVVDELQHVVRDLGFGAVAFMDDNFTGSAKRIHEICDGIIEKGLDIHWWCFSRADLVVRHPDMIRRMAEAGARAVFIGVESHSARHLNRLHKGIHPDQTKKAVAILKDNGLQVWSGYILGAPYEIRSDIRATIRYAKELDTDTAQFTLLTPYPGTALYEDLKDEIEVEDWSKYDSVHAVFRHPRIPRFELQLWLIWANLAFYFRHGKSIQGFFRFFKYRIKKLKDQIPY